jgi:hypothetical protein
MCFTNLIKHIYCARKFKPRIIYFSALILPDARKQTLNDINCSNLRLGQIDGQYSAPRKSSSSSESSADEFLKPKR